MIDWTDVGLSILKIVIILGFMLNVTPIMVWVERRGSALIQDRPGPNRVGPFGLFQSFADALKFILKEDMLPATIHAEKEGTFTNLQGRVQEIHEAYPPKGQAVTDLEIYSRISARLNAEEAVAANA